MQLSLSYNIKSKICVGMITSLKQSSATLLTSIKTKNTVNKKKLTKKTA